MAAAAVDTLIAREEALIAALDGQDVRHIEAATNAMRDVVTELAGRGGWHAEPELGARLVQALRLTEAAAGRLNFLADRNRRQLDRLATLTGDPLPDAYARHGGRQEPSSQRRLGSRAAHPTSMKIPACAGMTDWERLAEPQGRTAARTREAGRIAKPAHAGAAPEAIK